MIWFQTVRQGERVAVWDRYGRVRIVDGPQRVSLIGQTVEPLKRFSAAADEYVIVEHIDGRCEHLRGPVGIWFDPIAHRAIRVEKGLPIDSHEAVVVYRREAEQVARRVVHGPAMYVPTEDEWLHEFRWHGADPKNPRQKVPGALQFRKLWVIPDQMYVDVPEVRTADDALLVIKLMIFFELRDIERMLDQTHDPIADFINAATADTIDFAGGLSFEAFKQQTERLNDLATYENLTRRAERIGYRINKVVYRGYIAGEKLQAMHDHAIEARTALKLEAETERQAQDLEDLKLQREADRTTRRREIEQQQAEHKVRLERIADDQALQRARARHEQRAAARRELDRIAQEHQQATDAARAEFLARIKEMQVDLTRYLVAQYQHPDKLIRVAADDAAQLHVHEN